MITQKSGFSYYVNHWFQEILLTFSSENAERIHVQDADLANVRFWMHQNIDKPLSVDELVRMTKRSRTYFFQQFKKMTGMTPTSYFLQLKLEAAKIALQTTDQTVKKISESLHFYDEYHFSKLFKREYGISPSIFRKKITAQRF
jgi:AraC-like DNA-binding protein